VLAKGGPGGPCACKTSQGGGRGVSGVLCACACTRRGHAEGMCLHKGGGTGKGDACACTRGKTGVHIVETAYQSVICLQQIASHIPISAMCHLCLHKDIVAYSTNCKLLPVSYIEKFVFMYCQSVGRQHTYGMCVLPSVSTIIVHMLCRVWMGNVC